MITSAATRLWWVVADDLAVIGAYDHPAAVASSPPLTTIRVDTFTRMRSIAAAADGGPIQLQPLDQSTLVVLERGSL